MKLQSNSIESNYDIVGEYQQDRINGFTNDLIFQMLSMADLQTAATVLDAMAGDGNLSERMQLYCKKNNFTIPTTALLEYSKIQTEFARAKLDRYGTEIIWGDILNCCCRESKKKTEKGTIR